MKMKSKRLVGNLVWLIEIIPAYTVRFDLTGKENSLCKYRFKEMREAVGYIDTYTKWMFSGEDCQEMHNQLMDIVDDIVGLTEMRRNANYDEVSVVVQKIVNYSNTMVILSNKLIE